MITETLTDEGLGVLAAVQWRDEASPWSFWAQGTDAEGGANRAQIVNGGLTGFYSSFDMKLGLGLYWMTSQVLLLSNLERIHNQDILSG